MASPQSLFAILRDAVRHEAGWFSLLTKSVSVLKQEGVSGVLLRVRHLRIQRGAPEPLLIETGITYGAWLAQENEGSSETSAREIMSTFDRSPRISIICPTFNPDAGFLREAIASVKAQVYPNWELCIADDASTADVEALVSDFDDDRIRFVKREINGNISAASNSALELATGDLVTFLDQDDVLSPFALFWIAEAINRRPSARLIYSDEDKLSVAGERCDPHFKPDWNYTFQLAHNYLCHLSVYDADLIREVGGLREGFEGSQDHDLTLRCTEVLADSEICHVPRILYHWRKHPGSTAMTAAAKPQTAEASRRAVCEHLERTGQVADVLIDGSKLRLQWRVPEPAPAVTIVIPTRDRLDLLRNCIDGIKRKTKYSNYGILIVDNGSSEPETLQYLKTVDCRVVRNDGPFNFSDLVNHGIEASPSELICLMNNDIEVISGDWLKLMVGHVTREKVALVGAKLLYPDDTIQHGGVILGVGGVAGHAHKYLSGASVGHSDRLVVDHELSAVTGACMLLRKSAWREAGKFDPALAVAFNDIDFCLRVRDAGYKVLLAADASLYHHESKSRGAEDTEEKRQRFLRESDEMRRRWGTRLETDAAYNPNLTLATEDFAIAETSRNPSMKDMLQTGSKKTGGGKQTRG